MQTVLRARSGNVKKAHLVLGALCRQPGANDAAQQGIVQTEGFEIVRVARKAPLAVKEKIPFHILARKSVVHAREDDDGKFQPFRSVHRHDFDGVLSAAFRIAYAVRTAL